MTAETLLGRLHNVRQTRPDRWVAGCPLCQSRKGTPLTITEGSEGRILMHAFCGCDTSDVLQAVGLAMADLFPARLGHHLQGARKRFDAEQVLIALGHEITVCDLIAYDVGQTGELNRAQRERWHLAASRIDAALLAVDLPVPPELKRIRRQEPQPV